MDEPGLHRGKATLTAGTVATNREGQLRVAGSTVVVWAAAQAETGIPLA